MTTPKAVFVFLGILQGPSNRLSKRFKYVFQCSPSASASFVRTEFSPVDSAVMALKCLFWRVAELLGFEKKNKHKCEIRTYPIKNIQAMKLDYLGLDMVTAVIWGECLYVFTSATFLVLVMHKPFSTP